MPGSLNICFTWNNPPIVGENVTQPVFDPECMHYLVYQYEQGENGTYHWQGYVEFKSRRTFNQAREYLEAPGAACFNRRGSQQQAIDYCKKEATRVPGAEPFEWGTPKVTNQGARNDINEFRDAIVSGKRKRDLLDDHALQLAKFPKFYTMVCSMSPPERENDLKVYLLIGPPGCGKTRSVYEAYTGPKRSELFRLPLSNGTPWYDGYDGQRAVLFDDFSGASSHVTLTNLLNLLDRYPIMVPVKGDHTWWLPDRIYITTNIYPRKWYKWEDRMVQYRALARRIHVVFDWYEYQDGGDPPVGENAILPYMHEDYIQHGISLQGCSVPPRYEGATWWNNERPEGCVPWF